MRFKNGEIFVRTTGGAVDGDLIMKNNEYYQGYEADGTARNMLGMDSDDKVQIGVTTQPFNINTSTGPTALIGATSYNLLTSNDLAIKGQAADQSVNNSTVYVESPNLTLPVVANGNYSGVLNVSMYAFPNADIKWKITVPSGGTIKGYWFKWSSNPSSFTDAYISNDQVTDCPNGNAGVFCNFWYDGGSSAGNIVFNFAQNTAQASDATLYRNSLMYMVPTN